MDERTLRVLDYPKIREMLAEAARSSPGKRRALAINPATQLARIRDWLAETSEAVELTDRFGSFPLAGFSDISELLKKAHAGLLLNGSSLLRIASCLRSAAAVREYIERAAADTPRLWTLAQTLTEDDTLSQDIEASLDDEGGVRPDASAELVRLHRRAVSIEEAVRERLEVLMREAAARDLLQDAVIVSREGRFCLPIKVEMKSRFEGVVHDRSASGATVFMEPLKVVEHGNRLRETNLAIRQEEEALLQALTDRVGAIAEPMAEDQTTLGILDFIAAKASLALSMDAIAPDMTCDGITSLRSARHPLIADEDVVPISIWVGDEFNTLVITGPNTGGKTVCLKTIGLLTLMAMSGLHIPAEAGSQVSVFANVWADIGDEQSIEQSLSTFSSHMTQIVKIVSRVQAQRRRSEGKGDPAQISALVLLDEIGAGTDPTEGAALGKTLLAFLHGAGCRTVATTHYNSLKLFAYAEKGMENAAVQFDVKTLQPTYRLLIGHPGSSNAFDIAQRLGLPRTIVTQARATLDEDQVTLERAMSEMRESKRRHDRQRRDAQSEEERLTELSEEYEEKLAELAAREAEATSAGFAEALRIVGEAEDQARQIIARMQAEPRQSKATQQLRDQVAQLHEETTQAAREHEVARRQAEQQATDPGAAPAAPAPILDEGAWVHVNTLGQDGAIARQVGDSTYEVIVGNMRVEAEAADLSAAKDPPRSDAVHMAQQMQMRKAQTVKRELDLRGETVAAALLELEKYLDDAAVANISEVRIIHGKGTGALRQAIHEFLAKSPHVGDFALAPLNEGGTGATNIHLT